VPLLPEQDAITAVPSSMNKDFPFMLIIFLIATANLRKNIHPDKIQLVLGWGAA